MKKENNAVPDLEFNHEHFNLQNMLNYALENPDTSMMLIIATVVVIIFAARNLTTRDTFLLALVSFVLFWGVIDRFVDRDHRKEVVGELRTVLRGKPTEYLIQYRRSPEVTYGAKKIATKILNEERKGWSINVKSTE